MMPVNYPWVEIINLKKNKRVILIDHVQALDAEDISPSTMGGNIRVGAHCLLGAAKSVGDQLHTVIYSIGRGDTVIRSWEVQ